MCEPLGCWHHPVMGIVVWGTGVAAFAKALLGEALILYVGTNGRKLQAAATAVVQTPPA